MRERPLGEVAVRVLAEQRRGEEQGHAPERADDPGSSPRVSMSLPSASQAITNATTPA